MGHLGTMCCGITLLLLGASVCVNSQTFGSDAAAATDDKTLTAMESSVQPFYNLTNMFLNTVQPVGDDLGLSVVLDILMKNNTLNLDITKIKDNWSTLATTYLGYGILLIIGLLFVIFMPLVAVCFCCCRCCGRCGGHVKPMERKSARCRRISYNILLGAITTVMLAGVVLAFLTNDLLHQSMTSKDSNRGVVPAVNGTLNDMGAYFQKITKDSKKNLKDAIKTQVEAIDPMVTSGLNEFQVKMANLSNAKSAFDTFSKLVDDLEKVKKSVEFINNAKAGYESAYNNLKNTEFQPVKDKLKADFADEQQILGVSKELIQETKALVNAMTVSQDFTKIQYAEIQALSNNAAFTNVDIPKMKTELNKTRDELTKISSTIRAKIQPEIDSLIQKFNDSETMDKVLNEAEKVLDAMGNFYLNMSSQLTNTQVSDTKGNDVTLNEAIRSYDLYRMYAFIGLGCVCLLVIVFYYLGLCFGFCGEPPYEDAGLCNRGVGANLLMAGVAFAFLFCWLIMLITMVLFMIGAPMQTEACRYLKNTVPNGHETLDSAIQKLSSRGISLPDALPKNMVKGLLGDCPKKNSSLVQIFRLNEYFDQDVLRNVAGEQIQKIRKKLEDDNELMKDIQIYPDPGELRNAIQNIKTLVIEAKKVSYDQSTKELSEVVEQYNLIISKLNSVADACTNPTLQKSIRDHTKELETAVGKVPLSSLLSLYQSYM